MRSRWSDAEARKFIRRDGPAHGRDLALRVYTSRLLGADPDLVLHGGGNTSVKVRRRDRLGRAFEAIHVKGSGWSLDSIEPAGLPGMALEPLRRLRALASLSDEEMVAEIRRALLDPSAPTPSVETLLHAFLPHRFVDHSHADAVLVLTNQAGGARLVREAMGSRVAVLPWIMPGFPLAKAVAAAFERDPRIEGIVLAKHGLFTFGDDPRSSYEAHVRLVDRCERFLRRRLPAARLGPIPATPPPPAAKALAAALAPAIRGVLAEPSGDPCDPWRRFVLEWRASPPVLGFLARRDAERLAASGPLTPDHVIRTKGPYLLARRAAGGPEAFRRAAAEAAARYRARYDRYFEHGSRARGVRRSRLDPAPRVVLVPGVGLFAAGRSVRDARIAADIAERTLRAKGIAARLGRYEALSALDLFDMEYWSLEQAKLAAGSAAPLAGQVALVTGAAGAIGAAIGRALAAAGAAVALADLDAAAQAHEAAWIEARHGIGSAAALGMDVSDEGSVRAAFDEICRRLGGVDLVVPNAGLAAVGRLDRLRAADFDRLLAVNARGVFLVVAEAARRMRLQGTGGNVVIISSKNVLAPGASFGAYSASKAAGHQLGRIAALELASIGVRVNLVAPDAVFEGAGRRSGLWQAVGPDRARARGLSPLELERFYRDRSLLKVAVTGEHVAEAVLFFATNRTPTTGAVLPVDAGLPEAFPR